MIDAYLTIIVFPMHMGIILKNLGTLENLDSLPHAHGDYPEFLSQLNMLKNVFSMHMGIILTNDDYTYNDQSRQTRTERPPRPMLFIPGGGGECLLYSRKIKKAFSEKFFYIKRQVLLFLHIQF